eukprot:1676172-Amphidinium_carterae.1
MGTKSCTPRSGETPRRFRSCPRRDRPTWLTPKRMRLSMSKWTPSSGGGSTTQMTRAYEGYDAQSVTAVEHTHPWVPGVAHPVMGRHFRCPVCGHVVT